MASIDAKCANALDEPAAKLEAKFNDKSHSNQPLKRQLGLDDTDLDDDDDTDQTETNTDTGDTETTNLDTERDLNNNNNDSLENANCCSSASDCATPATRLLRTRPASVGGSSRRNSARAKMPRAQVSKFRRLAEHELSSTPAPNVKIGQRVAYKEYYGSEFGTIRWIGRVPQISPDWTVGVEFDNAIGEGDGSLNGRRYFTAKDCFAKFLALDSVACVEQHVGRPEPGTMISVMSAAVRPGQMISIQRVSTVHVEHCFLNAPHRLPGDDLLAVNSRLHCQCPNCGPCAHVVKPPRTQRFGGTKNATHMCQFSTYTCCGMCNQEDLLCSYTGNKANDWHEPQQRAQDLPPIGNSWFQGAGYLTQLREQQTTKLPDDVKRRLSFDASRRSSYKQQQQQLLDKQAEAETKDTSKEPCTCQDCLADWQGRSESTSGEIERPLSAGSIDSRLESDLERLSLARYGRPSKRRRGRNGPRRSQSISNEPASQHRLFKSLRSLIACFQPASHYSNYFDQDYDRQSPQCRNYGSSSIDFVDLGQHQRNSLSGSSSPLATDSAGLVNNNNNNNNSSLNNVDPNASPTTGVDIVVADQLEAGRSQQAELYSQSQSQSDCGFGSASQIESLPKAQQLPSPVQSSAAARQLASQRQMAELIYARIARRLLASDTRQDDGDQLTLELDKLRSLLLGAESPFSLELNHLSSSEQATIVNNQNNRCFSSLADVTLRDVVQRRPEVTSRAN